MKAGDVQNYIADIQVLRALAVTAVVMQHFSTWFSLKLPGTAVDLSFLWIGVDLFFVISAFLIVSHLLEHRMQDRATAFKAFWNRRFWRLFPAAAFWAVAAALLATTVSGLEDRAPLQVFGAVTSSLLGVSNFYWSACSDLILPRAVCSGSGPFGIYWSLSLEEQFYLLASVTILFGRLRLFILLLLIACVINVHQPWDRPWSLGWSIRPYGLAVGSLLALAWNRFPKFRQFRLDAADRLTMALVAIPLIGLFAAFYHPVTTAISCLLCGVLTWLALMDRCFSRSPIGYGLEWIGERSYSIYLCHMSVYLLVRELLLQNDWQPTSLSTEVSWLLFVACYAAILVTAHYSHALIEQRYRLKPKS